MLDAIILSPPYGDIVRPFHGNKPEAVLREWFSRYRAQGGGYGWEKFCESVRSGRRCGMAEYGVTPGQIGGLPVGELEAIVCSPPYAGSLPGCGDGIDWQKTCQVHGGTRSAGRAAIAEGYGHTPGQISALKAEDFPMHSTVCEELVWEGCYEDNWKGILPNASMAHPAKYARGLIVRIFRFGLERGFWAPGSLVGDPFCGVGCGGITAAYEGIRFIGCELEPRFVALCQEGFEKHRRVWEGLGCPQPVVIQGDSREFARIVREAQAIVTSPPYADTTNVGEYRDPQKCIAREDRYLENHPELKGKRPRSLMPYGTSEGQVGSLPAGTLDSILTSPPSCGASPGGEGKLNSIKKQGEKYAHWNREEMRDPETGRYLPSPNVGMNHTLKTYWNAMATIYGQCLEALKPSGVLCVVVKAYCKSGKIVDLPTQTCTLLEHLGFTVFLRVKAMLTKTTREPGLFEPEVVKTTKRISFFRRLHEKKSPHLAIDHEMVLFARERHSHQQEMFV